MKLIKIEPLKIQGFKIVEKDGEKFLYAKISDTRMFLSDSTDRLYLDLVGIEAPNSEYSDYIVKESRKQEESKEIDMPIIGDMKNWSKPQEDDNATAATAPTKPQPDGESPDDLPF